LLLPFWHQRTKDRPTPEPSWLPASHHAGQDRFTEAMRESLRPLFAEGLGVRIGSEFGWHIGQMPCG